MFGKRGIKLPVSGKQGTRGFAFGGQELVACATNTGAEVGAGADVGLDGLLEELVEELEPEEPLLDEPVEESLEERELELPPEEGEEVGAGALVGVTVDGVQASPFARTPSTS